MSLHSTEETSGSSPNTSNQPRSSAQPTAELDLGIGQPNAELEHGENNHGSTNAATGGSALRELENEGITDVRTAFDVNSESESAQDSSNENDGDGLEGNDSKDDIEAEKKGGRRKINIEFIENKSRRHVTFSKRKAGLIKKAYELSTLTGTQVLLLVASETGNVYTFATPKLQPLITKPEGKTLIQSCLNPPDAGELPAAPVQRMLQSENTMGYHQEPAKKMSDRVNLRAENTTKLTNPMNAINAMNAIPLAEIGTSHFVPQPTSNAPQPSPSSNVPSNVNMYSYPFMRSPYPYPHFNQFSSTGGAQGQPYSSNGMHYGASSAMYQPSNSNSTGYTTSGPSSYPANSQLIYGTNQYSSQEGSSNGS